ncbi:MAG: ATP-binding protein [Rhodospirillaceae bacterium]
MAGPMTSIARLIRHGVPAPLARGWSRLSLFVRLATVLGVCLGGGALLMFSWLISDDIRGHSKDLRNQASREADLLASMLTEYAILGDYATITQTLQRFSRQAGVAEVAWRPERGKPLVVAMPLPSYPGAELVHAWLALPEPAEQRRIAVGGRSYGEVRLQVSARSREQEIVSGIASYVGLLGLSSGGMLLCLMIVLRQALDPLKELDARVRRIEAGQTTEDQRPRGSPEVQRLIAAFNAMTRAQKASYEELERFSEVLAHHLQEPVRLQYAFAQKLQMQLPADCAETARSSLAYILKGALRLRALIRDVQLFLALKHLKPGLTPCNSDAAFAQARRDLAARLAEIGATVEADALPPLRLAESRLTDVFRALLDNAIEYRRADRPLHLRISATRTPDQVTVIVSDNGIGIPAEYRERVFRVFERLHSDAEHPGTGIGLSLVRKIVEAAGGTVSVIDGEDGGTAVSMTFGSETE